MLSEEIRFRLLKLLDSNPASSQRALARELGISLGRVNYWVNMLIANGLIKAPGGCHARTHRGSAYRLTPRGLEEKARMTARFLRRKIREQRELAAEIEQLRREASVLRQAAAGRRSGR